MHTIRYLKGALAASLILPPSEAERMPVTQQNLPEPETDKPESERAPLGILPGSDPTLP